MASLQEGDRAPNITAVTQDGGNFQLADYLGQQTIVLFFYPADGTPICTQEACAFRDAYEDFSAAGAVVIGVSGDSPESHRQFAAARRLPFVLLSDADGEVRQTFGVPKLLGLFAGRVTYVIDKRGLIRLVFQAQLQGAGHVRQALEMVKQLAAE